MKLLLLLIFPLITSSQKTCTGFIMDKNTGVRIPYVTVGLVRENKGVSADEHGTFSINSSVPKDSLRISSAGYETQVLSVSGWVNGNAVELQQKAGFLREVVISAHQQKQIFTLNQFKGCSSNWYQTGLNTIYQLAQRFEAPQPGMQLSELEICKDPLKSIFRIRLYDVDSVYQFPSKDLVDTIIEIRSSESHVRVDLKKYHIVFPNKSFFIAIEWLFIPFNEQRENVKRYGRKTLRTYYKPAIRFVHSRNVKQRNVWKLGFNGQWDEMTLSSQDHNFQITATLR